MGPFGKIIQRLKQAVLASVDRVFFIAFGGILAILLGIYFYEMSVLETTPEELEKTKLDIKISSDKSSDKAGDYQKVIEMASTDPVLEQTNYTSLIEDNPFDPKAVRDPEEIRKDALDLVRVSEKLMDQKDLDRAREAIQKALRLQRNFPPALRAQRRLELLTQPAETGE